MSETGQAITASIAFVSQVAKECEALAKLIKQEISQLFSHGPMDTVYTPGQWCSSYRTDTSGWIYSDVAWTLPLTPTRKRKPTAHLAFQMSFLCNNLEGGLSPEPLLHINLWDVPTNVRSEDFMGFKMSGLAPATMTRLRDGTARLFRWEAENGAADHWTFSLPLAHINKADDVREQICTFISLLLADVDAGEAALEDAPSVVRWSVLEETYEDRNDYYRVVL
ncbi:hypothetical protein [Pseudomonas sp. MYb118]|uniref:hypothetical protein n=1 Tax=Pseudomonas sp. MYb118 TaxID=1848720 RepID=UPI0034CF0B45